MNLFLALAWLSLGILVLAWQAFTGDPRWYVPLGDYRISYGYIMLLLVVFNLRRWWTTRAARLRRKQQQIESAVRQRGVREPDKEVPPNPDFIFTDQPPPTSPPQ